VSRTSPSRNVDADAAVWLARLHGDEAGAVRPALDAWLAESPAHAEAFGRANETWAILPRAARYGREEIRPRPERARPWVLYPAALAACLLLVVGFGAFWWSLSDAGAYATRPGEQKVATLADGSRIALNTDTRVDVRFSDARRQIQLERGEAMFEVAHDAARPFVVVAGDTRVQAIGTVFTVRRTRDDVVVTLIKGRVAVTHERGRPGGATEAPLMLRPGEKLTEPVEGPSRIEPESVEAATAWRRGQTVFDETPLGSAVSELNRYGGPPIVVDDPRVAALPVSGVFATNAPDFAEAVAALHGLRIEKEGDTLHIRR
jgi:transmembrane sensor